MSFDWLSRWTVAECPQCGAPGAALARSCAQCGAPKRTRVRAAVAAAGALFILVVAVGITALVLRRPPPPMAVDVASLTKVMQDCEAEAGKQPSTLYFLVVPMTSKPEDQQRWQSRSLNDIGNAILLGSDDALEGLKDGTLKITSEEYVFNVRDRANVLYNWKSSAGIARLTIPNADSIEGFNIQFQTRNRTDDAAWGNGFVRQAGTCYWVNAIIGN
jgi:hypothetical protein